MKASLEPRVDNRLKVCAPADLRIKEMRGFFTGTDAQVGYAPRLIDGLSIRKLRGTQVSIYLPNRRTFSP